MRKFWQWRRSMLEKEFLGIGSDPISYGYKDLADAELRRHVILEKISRINKRLNDKVDAWRFREIPHAATR